jgi:type I restriction enzyme M protein
MNQLITYVVEIMKRYPPYSINSIVSGICICLFRYIGNDIQSKEKITSVDISTEIQLREVIIPKGIITEIDKNELKKIITSTHLKDSVTVMMSKYGYSEQLSTAFETLCKFIANDDLLFELYFAIRDISTNEVLKNVMETLIKEELYQQLRLETGTPSQLNRLCMEILNPVNGSFYDGTAGIGTTIIDAHLYSHANRGNLEIYSQEIDVLCHAIEVLRAFLYEINSCFMYCGDTLVAPQTILDNRVLKTFDYSVMFPPLGLSWKNISEQVYADSYGRFMLGFPPTSSADWLFVQHQFISLKEGGKGIIALPSGALFNAATGKIREAAIRAGIIECIITLPPGMLPYTSMPINLMVISKTKKPNAQVLMIQAEKLFRDARSIRIKDASRLDESIIKLIYELYQERNSIDGISASVDINLLLNNDWVLLPSRYVRNKSVETEYGQLIIENPECDAWRTLSDVGLFYKGINVAPLTNIDETGEYKIINLGDVQNGEVQINHLARYNLTTNVNIQKYRALPGDLLISCKGNIIKICVVPHHTEQVLLSINFIGIRVNQAKYNPSFVKYFLESPAGQVFLQSKQVGTSITTLTARDLEEIPIPALSLELQDRHTQALISIEENIKQELKLLYTQSKQAKWDFYQNIGLGEVMKKGESPHDN